MRILNVTLLLVHAFVVSRLVSGAAVDRYESERQKHTSIINLLGTRNERMEEDDAGVVRTTVGYDDDNDEEEYYDYDDEDEDGLSGDYGSEFPRVAMSRKPSDPSAILNAERGEGRKRKGKGRERKGKKRNPCLKKYKDYCVHGTCQYLRSIRQPSCVCHLSYSGDRCQFFILPVGGGTKGPEGYNRTTALAVVAVVLSSLCLTIIGLLLALRFHKRGAYDVENEEKVKLGLSSHH